MDLLGERVSGVEVYSLRELNPQSV